MSMLDKKYLYFLEVAKAGSFSAAARRLYMSQSAVSQQIILLENEMQIKLFERSGYRPKLTAEGKSLFAFLSDFEKQSEQFEINLRKKPDPPIRVGITGTFENREVIAVLNECRQKEKDIRIEFRKTTFIGAAEGLISHEFDLSFGLDGEFHKLDDVTSEKLFPFEICVICSFDDPLAKRSSLTPEDIKDRPFVVLSREFGRDYYRSFIRSCRKDGFEPKIVREASTFDELLFAVSISEGISIVSKEVIRKNETAAVTLLNTHHSSNYVMAYRKEEHSDALEHVIRAVRDHFENHK